ncbi:MAG TPA: ATP-binding protein [Jatrophihabitantaceae bacterium]|nr:ATP-binding protein [Jatrophihabitantaceae bacterium]
MNAAVPAPALRRPNRSLRRRAGLAFAGFAGVLAVLIAITVIVLSDSIHRGDDVVYRWEPAVARSQSLMTDLVDQETGVRGYVLTAREDFLTPYEQGRARENADRSALTVLLHGHRDLLDRLAAFATAADAWRSQTSEPLIAAVRSGDATVRDRLGTAADNSRFDAVRAAGDRLTGGVRSESAEARTARTHGFYLLVATLIVVGIAVAAAAVAVWRGLHRWVLAPVDALAAQSQLVASGDVNRTIRSSGPDEFAALAADVDRMRGRIADELSQSLGARADLIRSNADLEQFAYVASHDLSEPLRKVANFCQLLERQYGPQLDDQARQYIGFAVDGARRMQALITDLLALSRVGRTTDSFVDVDSDAVLEEALEGFEDEIAKTGAGVGHSELPTVRADPALLLALFENLVGNALKYRGTDPPLIVVTAERHRDDNMVEFAVSDNGIGIDPQYAERIFAIFQRLHLRDEYAGTGIGLALCRKIVEFSGGRMWLDTTAPGPGATFRFTLPEGTAGRD